MVFLLLVLLLLVVVMLVVVVVVVVVMVAAAAAAAARPKRLPTTLSCLQLASLVQHSQADAEAECIALCCI